MKENYNIKRETDYVILRIVCVWCMFLTFDRPLT